jgi:non-canonical poly(A) RNA polymerase PAPD5/7
MVLFGEWTGPQALFQLKEELIKADICTPDGVKVLDKASVPIIKLTDRRTDVKVGSLSSKLKD